MKLLTTLLLLITISNSYAKTRVDIINEDGQSMSKEFDTDADADAFIEANKHRWGRVQGWYGYACPGALQSRGIGEETEYECPATYTVTKTDITAEDMMRNLQRMSAQNRDCGGAVKDFIAALNLTKGLTSEQIKSMLAMYADINPLLDNGMLDTAIVDITALVADGTLITESDKTNIIAKINSCKVTWQ